MPNQNGHSMNGNGANSANGSVATARRSAIPVMLASLSTGGHLRVGMEDTITYAKGRPVESNMQLVARAVGFAQLAQRPPLTAAETRELLGLASLGSAAR